MKIGIISNTFPPNLNGVSLAVKALKEGLEDMGLEVFLVIPKIKGVEEAENILQVKSLKVSKSVSKDLKIPYGYINDVVEFFRQNKVDIIHTHDTMIGASEGIVAANRLGIPCVHTYHTFTEDYPYLKVPGRKKIIQKLVKMICNNYDLVITPSNKVHKYLTNLGIKPPLIREYNVVKPLKTQDKTQLSNKAFKEYGLPKNAFVFTTFCRLAEEKSVENGLIMLNNILKEKPDTYYLIAGDGPEKTRLESLVKFMGLSKKVIFCGAYTQEQLPLIGSISRVFVFTSKTENLPTNILEAAELGLPILSVDDESVDYILEDGVNGYKGDLDILSRRVWELYNSKNLERISKASLQKAKKFLDRDVVSNHIKIYQRVIKRFQKNQTS